MRRKAGLIVVVLCLGLQNGTGNAEPQWYYPFPECLVGPCPVPWGCHTVQWCQHQDYDGDGDVDLADFAELQNECTADVHPYWFCT